jgi:hypothetical protein
LGTSGSSSADVESSIRGLSSASDGIFVGCEPVARIRCWNWMSSCPDAVCTVSDFGPVSVARPCTKLILRSFATEPRPAVSLSTTPCLYARSLSTSIFGGP